MNSAPAIDVITPAKLPRRRLVTRRRAVVAFLLLMTVLLGLELRQNRREAKAVESLVRQRFHVEREFPQNSIRVWLSENLLRPIHQEPLVAGPVTHVTDHASDKHAKPEDLSPLLEFPTLQDFRLTI